MPLFRLSVLAVALAAAASPVWAGIHNSAEPPIPLDSDLNVFLNRLAELRSLGPPDPRTGQGAGRERDAYLAKIAALRQKEKTGSLTADEAANLGAYLYRVRKTQPQLSDLQEATQTLIDARRKYPQRFAILANLGTVYLADGKLDAAESCLEEAAELAPPEAAAAERLQLMLVKRRLREPRQAGAPTLDALFASKQNPRDALRFVGPSGRYEIGALAPAELAKLPDGSLPKAMQAVQQLLVWTPEDSRLIWLLGELAAAQGQTKAAAKALQYCVDTARMSTPELKQHRALLLEHVAWSDALERVGPQGRQAEWLARWLPALAASELTPFGAPLAFAAAAEQADPMKPKNPLEQLASSPAAAPAGSVFSWDLVSWPIVVAGAAFVLLLVSLQVREWRKRRRRA